MKNTFRIILKILTWMVSMVILLVFVVFVLINIPQVQGFLKDTAVNYLSKKLHTKVELGRLKIDFPSSIELDHFYMADQNGDTLVYSDTLYVGIDMFHILSGHIDVHSLKLNGFSTNLYRTLPDTIFNFQYIIQAFASGKPAKSDTSGSNTVFTIRHINLSNIHVRYKDDVTGYDANINLRKFKTDFKIFNLDSLHFTLDSILLSGVHADIKQSAPLATNKTATTSTSKSVGKMPEISLEGLDFNGIFLHYNNLAAGMSGILYLGHFQLIPDRIDLNKQIIDLKKLSLNNTNIVFGQYKGTSTSKGTDQQASDTAVASDNWIVKLDQLQLDSDNLRYDDEQQPAATKGIDYHHLDVRGLTVHLKNGFYSADSSHATINNISLKEKSGFYLKHLSTEATYTSHGAELARLDLETANSQITKDIAISYPSLDSLSKDPGNMGIRANFSGCVIGMEDVLYFQPSLDANESLHKLMHSVVRINGKLKGKLSDLNINDLDIRTAQQTHLAASGHLIGLPDMKKTNFNIHLKDLSTGRKDLHALLPAKVFPSPVSIPSRLSLKGTYKGSLYTFASQLSLKSSYGNISLQGNVKNLNDSLHASYQALVKAGHFDLGKLLKNDSMYGKVTFQAAIKGEGRTKKSADARLKGNIQQAQIKGYNYENLVFKGRYGQRKGSLKMQMKDPNLQFHLMSSADLSGRYPSIKLNLKLDSADLHALHFTTDTLKFRGKVNADFSSADIDHLNGRLLMTDLQMVKNNKRFDIDSILLNAVANDSIDSLHLKAPFARVDISGYYQLSKAGDLIQSVAQHYFGRDSVARALTDSVGDQNMHIKLALINHPLWQMFMPSLRSFSGASFEGLLSSEPQKIKFKGNISQVIWGETRMDSLKVGLQSDSGKLNYALSVNAVNSGSLQIHKTVLKGSVADNQIKMDLKVRDAADKNKYHLAGILSLNRNAYKFSFNKDSILLNYNKWNVPKDNYIQYEPKGITVHDLKLESNGQYLLINSPKKSPGAPMNVTFHQFKLETLTNIASSDTAFVSGMLNGKVVGEDLLHDPVFTADLLIDSLAVKDQPVGNIAVKVNNKTANTYAVDVTLTGDSNNLKVTGNYYTKPQSKFDFRISIPSLNISSAQAFTFGQVKNGSGILTGNLHLQGTMEAPHVNGILTFKNAALTVTKLNDYIKMPDESIHFDDRGIHFDHFTLIDSLNNKAFIDGDILTSNFRHYRFALNLTARNFRALNAKKSQDELYYGPVFINAKVSIRGDENLPKVDMNLKMDKNSALTIVLPGSNPAVESSEGIVQFIDASQIKDTVQLGITADTIQHTALTGIQLSANISVDTAAILNIIIDPVNGDNLRVQGDATLNMTMDPSGKISLTGRYEISKGLYRMSLEGLIKRRFDIQKGSTITWTGDPTSAVLDLTAVYHVETSAMELVEDQLTDVSEATKNTYKQKLPFEVYLHINGELMKPDISFSLDMPETSRNAFNGSVYTRINQINTSESEVNKQVLGLLVLGHFIADNPFQSAAGGGGAEQIARQSASKILSQQLNNLADNLIQGVDLNFDLQSSEDYSTGKAENRTNLNVGISKSLFNGRTTIYVGSNIQLEGPQQANQKSSQIVGDVAIEYKLSRDGRYILRAYRKNKYEGVIEGQFIETGLSFVITVDYNHFKELFQKSTKKNRYHTYKNLKTGHD